MALAKTPVTEELVDSLKSKIDNSEVLTPGAPHYEDAIKRWSDAAVKRAVRPQIRRKRAQKLP